MSFDGRCVAHRVDPELLNRGLITLEVRTRSDDCVYSKLDGTDLDHDETPRVARWVVRTPQGDAIELRVDFDRGWVVTLRAPPGSLAAWRGVE